MRKQKILFLCTGNTARSQMAEAWLRKYAGDRMEVYSAGLAPGTINPFTVSVMEQAGLDMSQHYSKSLKEYLGKVHFSYLITVCDKAEEKCPIFPGMGQRLFWPFEDPAAYQGSDEQRLAKFREVRDLIEEKLLNWLETTNA
jgi:arsenate reductase